MLAPTFDHKKSAKVAFGLAGSLFWATGLIWGATSGDSQMLTRYIVVGTIGAISAMITLWLFTLTGNAQISKPQSYMEHPMQKDDQSYVTGLEIKGDHQGGAAVEVNSSGANGAPSTGMEVTAHGLPGQSVTGARVIQAGNGTGLKVTQSGPGVGFSSTAVSGAPSDK
ncbi:hypothetical protein [Methylocystis sp.]|uniref:hypothetical protein n=1 Tax=Methylocystis sp. TaxID=1911079 RepID=UPI0025E67DC4|nr:hypothetical protein [Methylocystis sp.]